ncbi:ribosome biogenesis protein SLX9-domain-containing protein [Achaetomium macrosporum]|uniref:Ribosome biogenesis protein SLX9 n=1 Tax=Achaetomium macrosporum TaxID=79813 RepID=A0AAN7HA06_9PEZI|nr:ribosome biogenesis protein SLX9-domain-containing protein [Achaetomium macrosporum]
MAPTAPQPTGQKRLTARQKARMRLADPLLPRKLHRENNVVSDSFINSKRDKRLIKHSAFVSRITKASSSSTPSGNKKRRRPNKKLVTTLESLGDALDDIQQAMDEQAAADGVGAMDEEQARQGKVRHKSLKTRPGALKRKERIVKGEMERFGRSLAQLANIATVSSASSSAGATTGSGAGGAGVGQETMDTEKEVAGQGEKGGKEAAEQGQATAQPSTTSSRWAALRGFISATMEQNPAFLGKT